MITKIETEQDYTVACERFEQVQDATTGSDHDEKMVLAKLINAYENDIWDLPDVPLVAESYAKQYQDIEDHYILTGEIKSQIK